MVDGRALNPSELIRLKLQEKAWSQQDLAAVTGFSRQTIYALLHDKTNITPDLAAALGAAFDVDPLDWLRLDGLRRLANSTTQMQEITARRNILEFAPVREMQSRGWIRTTDSIEELEAELKDFFLVSDLQDASIVNAAFRMNRTANHDRRSVRAWYRRARQLAEAVPAAPFRPSLMQQLLKELRLVAAFAKETYRVPGILGKYGIRFVIVEHLKGTKLDGAAFWLDDARPAIAMSVRYDRIDAFWFTLMHEVSHVIHGDGHSIDEDISGALSTTDKEANPTESRANQEAAANLVNPAELESFVNRVSPLYSAERIVQFAQRQKIHPGIVVGQLQNRRELGYESMRKFLVKIRDIATETALTDGWGKSAPAWSSER